MIDVPTDFDEEEMQDIEYFAKQKGMTVEEFTQYATNQYVEHIRQVSKERIRIKPKLRLHK